MKLELLKFRAALLIFICTLLVLLWVYSAGSKLIDITEFKRQLGNQTLGKTAAVFLFWFIPISEILAALLLLFNTTRFAGLILSTFLMFLFTGYIGLVLLGYYDRTPCSCGGVLKEMGWRLHFWFNVYFLAISGLGVWLERRKN
ncbi:MauE/DoxX family redox-associated membrane protein [Pedobacter sp. Du54]|uniref:MauE/DoxX family redox-associated membrane protein n=1 Tax=Pedobacter anseongensis TaxID=3133439 RepID=UPI00309BB9B6